ncbi:MAG: hypothetical protein ABR551_11905, partial [Gemmatimonadales bacterium]
MPTATLTVVVGSGVISSLSVGTSTYPIGTQLPYALSPKPGYGIPVAQLDGTLIPLAGVMTVDRDMALVAMADSIVAIPPEDQPLVESLTALRTNPDPGAAWQALQAELNQLYETVGPAGTRERLLRAIAVSLDPVADAAPLWRAMQAGLDAYAPAGTAGEPAGVPVTPCPGLPEIGPGVEVAIVYVNGINTDLSTACATAVNHLKPLLVGTEVSDPVKFPLGVSLNRSMKEADGVIAVCYFLASAKFRFRFDTYWDEVQSCMSKLGGGLDVIEAIGQLLNNDPQSTDVERLAKTIEAIWAKGGKALIVAHSQGNLLARDALAVLRDRAAPGLMSCVGVVSVAPPSRIMRPVTEPKSRDMIVRGSGASYLGFSAQSQDVLLLLPFLQLGEVATFVTPQTDWYDEYLARFKFASTFALKFEAYAQAKFAAGVALHSIDDGYLTDPITSSFLRAFLATQVSELATGCPVPPGGAPSITFTPSSLDFNSSSAASLPPSQTVTINNGGSGTLSGLAIASVTYAAGQPTGWLGAPTLSGTTAPATLNVRPNTTNLAVGTYNATVMIGGAGNISNSPATLNVSYTVTAGPGSLVPPTPLSPGTAAAPGPVLGTLIPTLSWSAVAGATGYGLYIRDLVTNTLVYPNASGTTTTPLSGTSFTLPSGILQAQRGYRWGATTLNGSVESTQSSALYFQTGSQSGQVIPTSPTNLAAFTGPGVVSLAWSDNANNEDGFRIERALSGTGTFVQVGTTGANVAGYADNAVSPGSSYSYRVLAYNGAGVSAPSNTVVATVSAGTCPAPIEVQGNISASTQWTAGSPGCAHYRLVGSITLWSSLTVGPGTIVQAASGAWINVQGSLSAVGTAAAPIRFLGEQPSRGYWRG